MEAFSYYVGTWSVEGLKRLELHVRKLFYKKGTTTNAHTSVLELPYNCKKRSILFEFPYWDSLFIRHHIDIMHVEKNVCEKVINTLLGIGGKTKDNVKACLDIKSLCIMSSLNQKIDGWQKRYSNCILHIKQATEDYVLHYVEACQSPGWVNC